MPAIYRNNKKYAGGGSGSGTTNYNELDNRPLAIGPNGTVIVNQNYTDFFDSLGGDVEISQEIDNVLEKKDDGLYVPKVDGVEISEEAGNIITKKDDGIYAAKTEIEISEVSGNIIEKKDDGLYAAATGVEISKETDNALVQKTDGLYVPDVKGVEISQEEGNIIEEKDDGLYATASAGTVVEANVETTEETAALTSLKVGDSSYSITKAIANYIDENFTNANVEGF